MNIHALQSLDGRTEAAELMSVKEQILNAQNNKPVLGKSLLYL
uniref:Uncharacterized protein n=1 Tax=viral metagenome TaxID=1070528 RepID=A0A6C0BMB8_9ZZZZ